MNVSFSPDGKTLAAGIFGGIIRLWDVDTGKHQKTIRNLSVGHYRSYDPEYIPLSLGGRKFVFGNSDGSVYLWDTVTKQEQPLSSQFYITNELPYKHVLISPDGKTVASWNSYGDNTIRLWDTATGKRIRTLTGHKTQIKSVTFSPDGGTMVSWSSYEETTIRLWEVATGKQKRTLKGHIQLVESVAFSPDGNMLASGGLDGTIHLWSADTGKQIHAFMDQRFANDLAAQSAAVTFVTFNSDANVLASGHKNGSIRLWTIDSGKSIQTLSGHAGAVSSIAFSPDGHTIASTSKDATVRLWDVNTREQKQVLAGYDRTVWRVFFYPNGLPLATEFQRDGAGDQRENIRLWDLRTGHLKKTLTGHAFWVANLSFSGDGYTLTSLSFDDTVLLWDLTSLIKTLDVAE